MTELKNCSFCGGEFTIKPDGDIFVPFCLNIKCIAFHLEAEYNTKLEAINACNTRYQKICRCGKDVISSNHCLDCRVKIASTPKRTRNRK